MSRPSERGYAVLWILALIAMISVVAAAAAPYLTQAADAVAVRRTAMILQQLARGVDSFNVIVKRGGPSRTTPHLLSQLTTTAVVNGGAAGCTTQTYNNTAAGLWPTAAPYASLYVPVGGIWTPLGKVNDAPSRTSATAATSRTSTSDPYFIQIPNVDYALAQMLDIYVDGTVNGAADTVRYNAPSANGTTLVSYLTTPTLPAC